MVSDVESSEFRAFCEAFIGFNSIRLTVTGSMYLSGMYWGLKVGIWNHFGP